ncbi:hypothetical protein ALC60_11980, partial [Trachymyrmex zeteki]
PCSFPRFLLVALPLASIAQFADTSLSIGWVGGPSWRLRDPRARWSGSDPGRNCNRIKPLLQNGVKLHYERYIFITILSCRNLILQDSD